MSESSFVASIDGIGSIPTSVAQVFGLISDPKATSSDFERVVRPDAGLTANLLKSANSAYYRASREITSVKDAIGRMGLRRVFEVVASRSFAKTIPSTLRGYPLTADQSWRHSIAVAVLADRIGRKAGFTYPDLAFTAGLLHDLGKVVIATWLSGAGSLVPLPDGGLASSELERSVAGLDHAEAGEAVALKWNLPNDIAAAMRWHHDPESAPTATQRYFATVVQVADGAAHGLGDGDGADHQVEPASLERLSLDPDALARLVEDARPEIVRTGELLRRGAS